MLSLVLSILLITVILGCLPAIAHEDGDTTPDGREESNTTWSRLQEAITDRLARNFAAAYDPNEGTLNFGDGLVYDSLEALGEIELRALNAMGLIEDSDLLAIATRGGWENSNLEFDAVTAAEIRFQKQCFLATNLVDIIQRMRTGELTTSGSPVETPLGYNIIQGGAPADITSLIVSRPDIQELMKMKPGLLSSFIPYIRIYKVFGDPTQPESIKEVEFMFDSHVSEERIEEILLNRKGRGEGVGLKSFSWEFRGVNPAEVENNIRAHLKLHFNNMRDFEEQRDAVGTPPAMGLKYRFSDLVIPEPLFEIDADQRGFLEAQRGYNPMHFRIKVVAGWSIPTHISDSTRELYDQMGHVSAFEDFLEAVRANKKVMYLNLIAHDISFNQDGSLELNAEYQAYAEGVFESSISDVLNVPKGEDTTSLEEQIEATNTDIRRYRDIRNTCGPEATFELPGGQFGQGSLEFDDVEAVRDFEENLGRVQTRQRLQLEAYNMRDRTTAYENMMERLSAAGRMYQINIKIEQLGFAAGDGGPPPVFNRDEEGIQMSDLSAAARNNFLQTFRDLHGESAELPEFEEERWFQEFLEEGTTADRVAARILPFYTRQGPDRYEPDTRVMRGLISRERINNFMDFSVTRFGDFEVGRVRGEDRDPTSIMGGLFSYLQGVQVEEDDGTFQLTFSEEEYSRKVERIKQWINVSNYAEGEVAIDFMFLGDLLSAVLGPQSRSGNRPGGTLDWLQDNNVGIYLGTFPYNEIRHHGQPRPTGTRYLPLAWIPISMELFQVWFLEEIVNPARTQMSIQEFIRSIFDKLVINAFGTDCVYDPNGEFFLTQEHFSVVPEFYTIPKEKLESAGLFRSPIAGITSNYDRLRSVVRDRTSPVYLFDYDQADYQFNDYLNMVLYQARSSDNASGAIMGTSISEHPEGYVGVAGDDADRGIYHLNIGSDSGLVRSVSFSRIDQPYVREMRLEQAGELGRLAQIRERYNVTISLYGNMFFYPGQHIYLNPSMVGVTEVGGATTSAPTAGALTTKLGIGGYYLIIKVENIIETGKFETILHCSWIHSGFRFTAEQEDTSCEVVDFQFQNPGNFLIPDSPEAAISPFNPRTQSAEDVQAYDPLYRDYSTGEQEDEGEPGVPPDAPATF